ncbi:MAG: RC-LH1 core complex protein PufX [Rhodobacterales bacterium]|nr:RC-LH1 core complex protein PufX [Rhodobacterales bacterium]
MSGPRNTATRRWNEESVTDDGYFRESRFATLSAWGLTQMLKGAVYAAAFLLACGLLLWGLWALGQLLPPESKQAPSPYGAIEVPVERHIA